MYSSFVKSRILFSFACILVSLQSTTVSIAQTTNQTDLELADTYFAKAKTAVQTRDTKTALPLIRKADTLYQQLGLSQKVVETKLLAYTCFLFSKSMSEWEIPLYQALPFDKEITQPSITKVKLYAALSKIGNINNQTFVAHYYGSKALEILQEDSLKEDTEYNQQYVSILYRMGRVEEFRHNYKKAEQLYQQSLEHARKHNIPTYLSFGGLFKIYTLTNQHEKITDMVTTFEAEDFVQTQPSFFIYDFYTHHIDYLTNNKLYQEAIHQSLVLKELLKTNKFNTHFSEWFLSERVADIHNLQGNYQKAIDELLNAKNSQDSLEIRNAERAGLYIKLAKNYLRLKNYTKAQYYSEEALILNTGSEKGNISFHAPFDLSTIEKAHKNILLDNLIFKAELAEHLYTKTQDTLYIHTKRQSYETAHELIKIMGNISDEDAFLQESQYKNVYSNLMQLSLDEWEVTSDKKVFENALQLRLQSQYVTILNELKEIKQHTDITSIPFIQNIRDTYQDYNKILYFWGQDAIYILNENGINTYFDRIPITEELEKAIDNVISGIRNIETSVDKKAHQYIYEQLFEKYLQSGVKTAVLLDDQLHLLPVSSLWIEKEERYLLEKTSIVHISTIISKREVPESNSALLMAPFATKKGIFNSRLSKSANELTAIGAYFNNDTYLDELATKESFLEKATSNSIIHLATHATTDTEDPLQSNIQFYEKENTNPLYTQLTLPEIYELELNASLVTLSACETGIGKEIKGKGVQSMANAFIHAGAASTIMSLWKVSDTETTTIMSNFYKYVKEGKTKDEALRQSKLDYLASQADYPALQHPYYWSGFIVSGDPVSITKQGNYWMPFIAVLIILAILVFVLRKSLFQRA